MLIALREMTQYFLCVFTITLPCWAADYIRTFNKYHVAHRILVIIEITIYRIYPVASMFLFVYTLPHKVYKQLTSTETVNEGTRMGRMYDHDDDEEAIEGIDI